MQYSGFKGCADRFLAFFLLFSLWPLLLFISVLVFIFMGSPVLFIQQRPGYRNRLFSLYKFRTMRTGSDSLGRTSDLHRLTRFGQFLRSTSLDELPSLINILNGDMSFIGPRPLLPQYLPLYTPQQARRHDVKPGFSGWAQVNGRNSISWTEKFRLDVWYVDNQSFWLDFRIFLLTIWKVICRDGITAAGEATAKPFAGSLADK